MLARMNSVPRFYVYIFLFLGLLSNFSCQEFTLIEDVEITSDEDTRSDPSTYQKSFGHIGVLESRMQWASYISARIFCQNHEAREEVATFLELQNSSTLSFDQLIVSTEHTPIFREAFRYQVRILIRYIEGYRPEPTRTKPIPPSSGEGKLFVSTYIEAIAIKNCIELFFPNGLSSSMAESYYSTSHPMTLAQSNFGYELSCADIDFRRDNWGSTEITNDRSFVKSGREVIVARPYRTESLQGCPYSEYDHIDFAQFLNQ